MKIAVYPGTFDPITNGHIDIIDQALEIFDQIVVTVAENMWKTPLFTLEERIEMIRATVLPMQGVRVEAFEGLSVEAARRVKAVALIRGIRTATDFENEYQMTLMNRQLARDLTTVFFMTGERYSYIRSSLVKEIARFGGDVSLFVPPVVAERLKKKFARDYSGG